MKLNIYNKKEIVKTYTAERYDIEFGVLEDVADAINLDALKNGSQNEIMEMALQLVIKSKNTVKDLMKDIFDGITDEELRHTRISELAFILVGVVKMTIEELAKGFNSKN